ncbi:FtsK/SpoIIIE domain-containing protein [Clostridium sp. DSM 100503]|uniref:FtsK/SpoIIIE domain-containing protein n=2 Tax=Bacillota TaxID=1239 RepID=UPI00214A4BCF|nr:FtsK/SpoIIIE domain-containing protein [Clostridium sp. DSM 100503]MCR1953134.1 FtsK/SpoIIIE domain-containing protein [Clostridium sp. DSM 100503]
MKRKKGVRIQLHHKNIILKMFLLSGIVLFTAFFSLFLKIKFKTLNNVIEVFKADFKEIIIPLVIVLLLTIAILIILKVFLKKLFYNLKNIQKLSKLIINNNFYIVENIKGADGKSKKKCTYFPKIYYWFNKERIYINIELDGSKFHSKYLELGSKLEQMYNSEIVDKIVKNSEVTYILQVFTEDSRIILDLIKEQNTGTKIPLMKGIEWDIVKIPHCLVTGATGGGKSYFLFYLVRSFFSLKNEVGDPLECIVKVLDPKMSDLSFLDSIMPDDVFFSKDKILKELRLAVEEMEERYTLMRKEENQKIGSNFLEHNLKPYVIFFDEFIAFAISLEKSKKEELRDRLFQIILKGRQAGIFIVLTGQRADAEFMPGAIRDNLGLRVSLGNLSKDGYKMTFGDVEKEFLERTEKGQGYVYLMGESKYPMEFYSPLLSKDYNLVEDVKGLLSRRKGTFQAEQKGE